VLRNGADKEQALTPPVGLDQLAGLSVPSPIAGAVSPAHKVQRPKPYQVETILGDKQVVNGFN
jgi:hypothetical protein